MFEWKKAPNSAIESFQRMKYTQVSDVNQINKHTFLVDSNGDVWHSVSKRVYGKA